MTTTERKRTNFEGNERVDLPDYRSMINRAYEDFRWLLKTYIDQDSRRIVKRYQQGFHAGLTFKIVVDDERAFHDADREWVYKDADVAGTTKDIVLSPSTTNYIEVSVNKFTTDLQTRAFWNTDIGITGEEFFDDINVLEKVDENITRNSTGFSAGAVPLWEVQTDATGITAVIPHQDLLWKPRSVALPVADGDRDELFDSLKDLRGFIDYLGAFVGEMKGGSQSLENVPWSSLKLLKEYQNLFITGGGEIGWETAGSNIVSWSSTIGIDIARRAFSYAIDAGNVTLSEGEAAYVAVPEGTPGASLVPIVVPLTNVPLDPSDVGFSKGILVLFYRKNNKIYSMMELPELDSGESSTIGEHLPTFIRNGLGVESEVKFKDLVSTRIIEDTDDYADRFSKLDDAIGTILDNTPEEEEFFATAGDTQFTAITGLTWMPDNNRLDIMVFVNGKKQKQDRAGALNEDYRKVGSNMIEFSYPMEDDARVTIFKQGYTSGGINPPAGGNLWSDPVDANIIPSADAFFNIGQSNNRIKEGYFAKVVTDQLVVTGSLGETKQVKQMVNNTGSAIPTGTPISKKSDGSIVPCDSDHPDGQAFIGIALDAIPALGGVGRVNLIGRNLPSVLSSYSFSPGDEIFIGENGEYVNSVLGFSGGDDSIIKVGVADCAESTASGTATDLIMFTEIISRPL